MAMDALTPTGQPHRVVPESSMMVMMSPRKTALTTITRRQPQVQAVQLLPTILTLLNLSALLVGNYLTVARVGIIMISLDRGATYLTNMDSSTALQDQIMQDHIRYPTYILETLTGVQDVYTIKATAEYLGHLRHIQVRQLIT